MTFIQQGMLGKLAHPGNEIVAFLILLITSLTQFMRNWTLKQQQMHNLDADREASELH